MKSFLQLAVPIVILMVIVGVVAYVTQNTARPPEEKPLLDGTKGEPVKGEPITFDDDPVDLEGRPMEVEFMSDSHKDFWFHTAQERDVQVSLVYKSCDCSKAQLGSFDVSQDEWEAIYKGPLLSGLCRLLETLKFAELGEAVRNEHQIVAGTPTGRTPKPHIVRVNWKAKKTAQEFQTAERMRVRIGAQVAGASGATYEREFLYLVVPTAALWPFQLDAKELNAGSKQTIPCIVWSQTREVLSFKVRMAGPEGPSSDEPCAEISDPVQVPPQELADLPRTMGPEFQKMRPRCAYRFDLTVHESRGDHQLELGPLDRRLTVSFNAISDEAPLKDMKSAVTGLVRGDVRILNGDSQDRIALGGFKYDKGKTHIVRLGTADPKLELEVDQRGEERPEVEAQLTAPMTVEGRKEWTMTVTIKPNTFLGEIPAATQIVLKTKGPNPRRVRIPVTGKGDR